MVEEVGWGVKKERKTDRKKERKSERGQSCDCWVSSVITTVT